MLTPFVFVSLTQVSAAHGIMSDASDKLHHATSVTVTVTVIDKNEESPPALKTEYAFRKGGYLRIEQPDATRVSNPKAAWAFSPSEKEYNSLPLSKDEDFLRMMSLGPWASELPVLNGPSRVIWHGMPALRIGLDGKKEKTNVSLYYDPKTHLPLGMSSTMGSIAVQEIFEHLKLNPRLDDRLFQFTPPHGWTQVKI